MDCSHPIALHSISDGSGMQVCPWILVSCWALGIEACQHVHRPVIVNMLGAQRAQGSKISRFRAGLKISSELEIFERATHRGPIFFCGEIETSRLKFSSEIKNFDRDQKFRSGSNFFDRWALWGSLVVETVVLENGRFAPAENGGFDENWRKV